jgi:hypothetical protein
MGGLKNRFDTLVDAITLRRVIALPLIIAVITALVRLAPVIARAEGAPMFLGVPPWMWGVIGGLLLLAYFLLEYGNRKRLELQPKFDVVFPASGLGIVSAIAREPTPTSDGRLNYGPPFKTRYCRIQIDNLSGATIKNCVAGITALEKRRKTETDFVRINLPQTVFLRNEPFDVYPNMPCTVDFLRTDERVNKLAVSPGISWPYILENVFDDKGAYRFTVTVNGEGVSKSKVVEIDWDCQWDTITGR